MPNPVKGESRSKFVQRFMSDDAMKKKYPKRTQRFVVAKAHWDKKKRGGR